MKADSLAICGAVALAFSSSNACDSCGCFTQPVLGPHAQAFHPGFYAGVSEQFTHFGTLQFDGDEVANPTGQYLDSSITQLFAGYDIN